MKKILITLTFIFAGILSVSAQQAFKETVFLKNGSMIKGIVIEQVPNESLKIQTADGSIFVYKMSEIEKITKEAVSSASTYTTSSYYNSPRSSMKGYRGFVEFGYTVGAGSESSGTGHITFLTSHGYQFNQYLFLGVGSGVNYYTKGEAVVIPVFANPRVNFMDNNISPFLDLKIGYSFVDAEGFFLNPSVGVSFAIDKKMALNFGIGYTLQKVKFSDSYYNDYNNYYDYYEDSASAHGISFKVGFEF